MEKVKKLKNLIIVICIVLIAIFICVKIFKDEKPDTKYLTEQLQKSSELTSAKVKMTGIHTYKDNGIFIINKQNFIMVYDATVRAGFNLENVEVKDNKLAKQIEVYLPKAEIQEVKVDSKSIKYYDESFALFNLNQKEDSNKAISEAEESAKERAKEIGILELADSHAETLIKGILLPSVPKGYDIKIIKK